MSKARGRSKPQPEPVLRSWDEADAALREIGAINRQTEGLQARLDERVAGLKASALEKLDPLAARKSRLEKDLQEYSDARRDADFGDGKTKRLTHGTVSYRISRAIKPERKLTWAKVLDLLKDMGRKGAHWIRTTEAVDKDALRDRALAGDDVSEFGCRLHTTDVWGYTIDEAALVREIQSDG